MISNLIYKFIDEQFIDKIEPLPVNSSLYDIILHFKKNTEHNFVPIVDEFRYFLGIIYESDIKKYLTLNMDYL